MSHVMLWHATLWHTILSLTTLFHHLSSPCPFSFLSLPFHFTSAWWLLEEVDMWGYPDLKSWTYKFCGLTKAKWNRSGCRVELFFSPQLCVGFLFLVVHFRLAPPGPASPPLTHTHNLSPHNLLTHNLHAHSLLSHNLSPHNLPTHNLSPHNLLTWSTPFKRKPVTCPLIFFLFVALNLMVVAAFQCIWPIFHPKMTMDSSYCDWFYSPSGVDLLKGLQKHKPYSFNLVPQ